MDCIVHIIYLLSKYLNTILFPSLHGTTWFHAIASCCFHTWKWMQLEVQLEVVLCMKLHGSLVSPHSLVTPHLFPGRGRGRPRQRPKIQGLPPPQDKEEAKEQTATFHRVYERVRRTEIKKGYDTLENLIPFHLRSDVSTVLPILW